MSLCATLVTATLFVEGRRRGVSHVAHVLNGHRPHLPQAPGPSVVDLIGDWNL
jgi:hypothetical protein